MQQTQFIRGEIWGALGTIVTISGDSTPRAGLAWFRVQPRLNAQLKLASAQVVNQGYVASAGNSLLYPAIQSSARGNNRAGLCGHGVDDVSQCGLRGDDEAVRLRLVRSISLRQGRDRTIPTRHAGAITLSPCSIHLATAFGWQRNTFQRCPARLPTDSVIGEPACCK